MCREADRQRRTVHLPLRDTVFPYVQQGARAAHPHTQRMADALSILRPRVGVENALMPWNEN